MQVPISPGMGHNQKIPFRGKSDELVSEVVCSRGVCVCV